MDKRKKRRLIVGAAVVALFLLDLLSDGEIDLLDPLIDLVEKSDLVEGTSGELLEEVADELSQETENLSDGTGEALTAESPEIPAEGATEGTGDSP